MTTEIRTFAFDRVPGIGVLTRTSHVGQLATWTRVQENNNGTSLEATVVPDTGEVGFTDREVLYMSPCVHSVTITDKDTGAVLERASSSAVVVDNDSCWLSVAGDMRKSMPVRLVGRDSGASVTDTRSALLRPLGRKNPVVITDVRSGAEGTVEILTLTDAEERRFRSILDTGLVLLFSAPAYFDVTYPFYLVAGAVAVRRTSDALGQERVFTLDWTEVDRPGGIIRIEEATWGWYRSQDTLWQDWGPDAPDGHPDSWAEVATGGTTRRRRFA